MVAILVWLAPARSGPVKGANERYAKASCEWILRALRDHADTNEGFLPDGPGTAVSSANQVFRSLLRMADPSDERFFGCPGSVFNGDHETGGPPRFEKALMPGECHWMLLKHQTLRSHAKTPVVIECCESPAWPPRWMGNSNQMRKRQAWPSGEVIIGRLDGTVALEKLRPDGTLDWHSKNNLDGQGKSWIDYLTPEEVAKLEYWDIEEKTP